MGRDIKKGLSIGVKSNRQLSLGAGISAPETKEKETNSVKESLLARATQNDSKNLIKELYRSGSKIGDGGTADALRHELKTGKLVGGKSHKIKAQERVKQIENILKKNPNHPDKDLLNQLKDDLEKALRGE